VGMLALTLKDNNAGSGNVTVEITYEPGFTILSLVFAVLAAFGSFLFATNTFHHLHSKLMVLDIVLYRTRVLHKYNHPKLFKFCSHLSGGVFGALAICGMHFGTVLLLLANTTVNKEVLVDILILTELIILNWSYLLVRICICICILLFIYLIF
jgi:NO-binding membrane sensor protein with MHYT domain